MDSLIFSSSIICHQGFYFLLGQIDQFIHNLKSLYFSLFPCLFFLVLLPIPTLRAWPHVSLLISAGFVTEATTSKPDLEVKTRLTS